MTRNEITEYIKLPKDALFELERAQEAISRSGYRDALRSAGDDFFSGGDIGARLDLIAVGSSISPDMARLVFCFEALERTYALFCALGHSDEVFLDSVSDMTVWAKVCARDWGGWGMHEFDWLSRTLRAKLFRFGRLQFELVPFSAERYDRHGVHVRRGDEVINTHIPEGGPMPRDSRIDAYRRALRHFGRGVFVCESYLLYPRQREFLPPHSNILSFMDDFDIIEWGEDSQNKDMWRIFGRRASYAPETLPRDTSLQRAYADHLARTGVNGWGYGVMVFNESGIVKDRE